MRRSGWAPLSQVHLPLCSWGVDVWWECRYALSWPKSQSQTLKGCEFESRAGRDCRWGEWIYSALFTLNTTTEEPLSKSPNPQLFPGRCSINDCPLLWVCVHGVCVFTLCVCACALGWVNAEYEFRVWVSKPGCMSRHFHFYSDRKKTERSHFTLAFPNSTWTHFYKWWTKSIQEFTEQKYLTNRWLIHKRKIIPVLFILPLFIYFHSIY